MSPSDVLRYQQLSDRDLLVRMAGQLDSLSEHVEASDKETKEVRKTCAEEKEATAEAVDKRFKTAEQDIFAIKLAAAGVAVVLVSVGAIKYDALRWFLSLGASLLGA